MISLKPCARLGLFALAMLALTSETAARDETGPEPSVWPADAAYRGATVASDLTFPAVAEADSGLTSPRMALLKPADNGPFPAIVLMHQCSGLGPFVDRNRVALVGFSWGAMVGLLASSSHYVGALKADSGFAAVASFYPGCFRVSPQNGRPPFDMLNADIDRPLLVLMGDADTETPASDCLQRLTPMEKAGAPVEWHLYPETTHCWDCQQFDGLTRIDVRGNRVEYRFRRDVTEDSERRLLEFLNRAMPKQPR